MQCLDHRARFRTEAKAVAAMGKHPNIVTVYDLGEDAGVLYYAMELVAGMALSRELRDFTPSEAARLVEKVARAVHFAHQHQVIHRDLKPDNVILAASGEPQVMDFGLARQMDGTERQSVVGTPMGTPRYMAPEQARGRIDAMDARTDVYGLGGILYGVLFRRPANRQTILPRRHRRSQASSRCGRTEGAVGWGRDRASP